MGILEQQFKISQAMASGRTVPGHTGNTWVMRNLAASQVRDVSRRESELVSGYFGGSAQRPASMYPDNRTTLAAEDMVINSDGNESIRKSRTAAQIETQIELI